MSKPKLPLSPDFIQAHDSKLTPLLSRFKNSGALHSTLLFSGVEGVGKKSLVLYFVQMLFCDEFPNIIKPCGSCKSCIRSSQQDQWLDFYWFEPESNDEGTRMGQHKVEVFRELKAKFGLGPSEEPFKIVVIAEAERMTPSAANSILKMLEEPPKNWIFILTASDSSRLLPTILSRCNEIKLSPLSPESIYLILKNSKDIDLNSARGKVASRAAMGSLSRAIIFSEDEAWELRTQIFNFLAHPAGEWSKLVDTLARGQREMHLGLDLIESILSDILHELVNGASHEWTHDDQKEMLTLLIQRKKLNHETVLFAFEKIAEMRKLASLTLNAKLLAQEILTAILAIL